MKILFISSEVEPFAKTGGLADVAGALPKELAKIGHELIVVMPRYKAVNKEKFNLKLVDSEISVTVGDKVVGGAIYSGVLPGSKVKIYFIENKEFFDRDGLYQTAAGNGQFCDFIDNAERFIFFNKASLELCKKIDWRPDVIHCHDWQAGLVPVYLKSTLAEDPFFKGIKTVFTIHNLAYQGLFDKGVMEKTGLSWDFFTIDKMEFWGKVNFLKTGLVFSDILTTVSETYSKEIQTEEFGAGLNGLLSARKSDLYGIVNGIDYNVFSPQKDEYIKENYSRRTIEDKQLCKKALLKEVGLKYKKNMPVFGIISRLVDQKGFDLIAEIVDKFLELKVQLIVLGTGDPKYHQLFSEMQEKHPDNMKVFLTFNNDLAHKIYAGSDLFLMPSRYEPCGLGQLISLKYGTIPVVRETGGLADTIVDFDLAKDFENDKGNGFVFLDYNSEELYKTLLRAVESYKDDGAWKKIISNAMKADYSWKVSALRYEELYKKLMG